mgnify:CR=1 FL=1
MSPQQLLLSLDYELFFGCQTGSVENCLISPTHELAQVADRHDIHLSLFVDALYLQRLAEEARRFPRLQSDLDAIRQQLVALREKGHDIQLHLHPHWLDSSFDGEQWQLDTDRYKLHDFPAFQVASMVGSAKKILTSLIGDTVFAFRAGGWCLQPFTHIAPALQEHAIWLDSTVFADGISDDPARWFDFSSAPVKDCWYFHDDPTLATPQGAFFEVPISAMRVTPFLFWRMALTRKIIATRHKPFGDGSSLSWNWNYYLQRLTRPTISVASIDGLKAGLLGRALSAEQKAGKQLFHAMGHPKAVTRHSLERLDSFFPNVGSFTNITFQDFKSYQPKNYHSQVIAEG